MPTPHTWAADPDGDCEHCPLPQGHPVHKADATAAPLAPVDRPLVRRNTAHATETSKAAAAAALPRSGSIKARCFDLIASRAAGYTDDELEVATGLTHQNVSAARNALVHDGWVKPALGDDEERLSRLTRTGSPATVWVPTAAAYGAVARGLPRWAGGTA